MVYLGAVLGLRWGECAGLRVGRINFDECTIRIVEQVTRGSGGRSVLGRPRSKASRRTLAVPRALISMLEEHLGRLDLTRTDGQAFVFPLHDSEHLDYSNWLHRIWYPARTEAELDWVQFHDLRRVNATGLVIRESTSRRRRNASVTLTHDSLSASTHRPPTKPIEMQRNDWRSAS
jgi:integrase